MANKKKRKIFIFHYAPLVFWLGLIFYFSSLPGLTKTENPDFWFYFFRKGAHVVEYFILAFLFFRVFRLYKLKKKEIYPHTFNAAGAGLLMNDSRKSRKARDEHRQIRKGVGVYLLSFLFSLAYAFSDEIHQVFIPGREGKFSDVGFDAVGIIAAILLYSLLCKKSGVKWKYIF